MVDLAMFGNESPGDLVEITGSDPDRGPWRHRAFVPYPLPDDAPALTSQTYLAVANARAALAALDSTAQRLPNAALLRSPTLRTEAQSTSALEGTYAGLADVLTADEDDPHGADMREILNYVRMADRAFGWVEEGRPLTASLLNDLQRILMRGTALEDSSGRLRDRQVVIGLRPDLSPEQTAVESARFVPSPPGDRLAMGVQSLVDWLTTDRRERLDPVVGAAMAHYQFEALHPFRDGNGRLGRLLVVLHLLHTGVLTEPTLTVSPWFESQRGEYFDALLGVSTTGDWDTFVGFFARGLRAASELSHRRMLALTDVQAELRGVVRKSPLRAENALRLVDMAIASTSFTVRQVERELGVSYPRANALVSQLVNLGVLDEVPTRVTQRRFAAPAVLAVLMERS